MEDIPVTGDSSDPPRKLTLPRFLAVFSPVVFFPFSSPPLPFLVLPFPPPELITENFRRSIEGIGAIGSKLMTLNGDLGALTNDSIHQAPHQAPLSSLLSPTSRNTRSSTSQASQTSTRPFATGSTSNLSNSLPSSNNNNNNQGNGLEGDEQFDDSSLTAALVAALVQTRDGPHPQTSASTSNSNSNQDSNGVNPAGAQGQEAGESNDGEGEGQGGEEEEMAEGEGVSGFDGTTTRSGRKTRRTSAALASMSQSGTPSPSATPASGANGKKSARIRWTPQEDEELIRLVKEEPPLTWTQMGERMGRPGAGCAMRWYNFVRQQVGGECGGKLYHCLTFADASSSPYHRSRSG